MSQNNDKNSNIIIIINNSSKKKIINIIKLPEKIRQKHASLDIKDNRKNNDKVIIPNLKKKKINNKLYKNNGKLETKDLKIETNNKTDNNIINNIHNDRKINQILNNENKENILCENNNHIINEENSNILNESIGFNTNKELEKNKTKNANEEKRIQKQLTSSKNKNNNIVWNNTIKIRKKVEENNLKIFNNKNFDNNPIKMEEYSLKEDKKLNLKRDNFPLDSVSKLSDKLRLKLSIAEIPQDSVKSPLINLNKEKKGINPNNFLSKKESENQILTNSSPDKIPLLKNNSYNKKQIQEKKSVIQYNIERKRPVFTLPSKIKLLCQKKRLSLIRKYYDENFILEDDEEEEFKQYIFNIENNKDESLDK